MTPVDPPAPITGFWRSLDSATSYVITAPPATISTVLPAYAHFLAERL